jgi:hypothetical protein
VPGSCSYPQDFTWKNSEISTTAGGGRKLATSSDSEKQTPIFKKKYKLKFTVDPQCLKKIEEAKALL